VAENFEQTLFKAADKLRKNIDGDKEKQLLQGLLTQRENIQNLAREAKLF
jgi:hypothetical protein